MSDLWIATTNRGKMEEFKILLADIPLKLHAASELPVYSAPPENGMTFLENARIKAKSMKAMKPGVWIVAEDSGLEVKGLDGMPGVHSARYAGNKVTDIQNISKLLKMMSLRSADMRDAQFKCVMVVFDPQGAEHIFEGVVEGEVSRNIRGTTGFGYDPVFVPKGETKTFAELGLAYKNAHSHRANAIKKFRELLKSL